MSDINGIDLGVSGSSFNAKAIIEKTMEKQQKLIEPAKTRLEKNQVKLDTWGQAKTLAEAVRSATDPLIPLSFWNKKKVSVSNEEILTASAGTTAEPGTHYITVKQVALSHMLGSQTYDKEDAYVGTGELRIRVGDNDYKTIKIEESQNTLKGLVDAINNAGIEVKAQIIKTDHSKDDFRIVITSQASGREGYVEVVTDFEYENAPLFDNFYSQPSDWKFAKENTNEEKADNTGASNTVPVFSGNYQGEEDIKIKFTVMNTGKIGGDNTVNIRWEDDQGRIGTLDFGKFSYSPGTPVEVVDGIKVSFTEGDVIINDSFEVEAKPDETGSWWVSKENEPSKIYKPTVWKRQYDAGKPLVTGQFSGEDDDIYTIRVAKGGIIGQTDEVILEYESENGEKGTLHIGAGYNPGDKLSLGQGLELSLEKGVLQEGFESKFEAEEGVSSDYWWLFSDEEEDGLPPQVSKSLNWYGVEGDQVSLEERDLVNPENNQSNVSKEVSGEYLAMENKNYKFTVEGNGTVGITRGIYLRWEDNKGNEGTLNVGDQYKPETPLEFDNGLSISLGKGQIFNDDSFTVDAFSSTIQPAQDAVIQLGADPSDGGLQITNSTNEFKEAIRGITLNVHQAAEEAVVLTIEDDQENIKENISALIEKYNEALAFLKEALKYDISTEIAGPLQADSNASAIERKMREIIITPIQGLAQGKNTLSSAGITIDKTGLIEFDEQAFNKLFNEDYKALANLFRNYGDSDNSSLVFLNAGVNTRASQGDGYKIDVTQAATAGYYKSPVITQDIEVNQSNKDIRIIIDGKESGIIKLDTGSHSLKQFAKDLEKKIEEDDNIGNRKFSVITEANQMTIRSGTFGSSSSIEIKPVNSSALSNLAILDGETEEGKNVVATIDGEEMEGQGRVLRGKKDTKYEGLRLYSFLTESQLKEGAEANLRLSKGVAQRIKGYMDEILATGKGLIETSTQGIKEQVKDINDNIKRFDERLKRKKDTMVRQFATMEAKISELQSQQKYIRSQFPGT